MKISLNTMIGEYRILNLIGIGGMGEVYRAVHINIERIVAIKIITNLGKNAKATERFINEARIHANLHHPNIATFFEFVEFKDYLCIVMEYVEGQVLEEQIKSCKLLPSTELIRVFQAIVEAVAYLHSHNIVHRDIKSNNIKITSMGKIKLLDFGIAKDSNTPQLTEINHCIGTLSYLAPEQVLGKCADTRSDIWSLGILLYEMVTGDLPFEATSIADIYSKIVKAKYIEPVTLNPSIPHGFEMVIARCLKKNPNKRYQSAGELLADIQQVFFGSEELAYNIFSNLSVVIQRVKSLVKNYWPFIISSSFIIIALAVINLNDTHILGISNSPSVSSPEGLSQSYSNQVAPLKEYALLFIGTQDGKAEVWLQSDEIEKQVGVTPYRDYYSIGENVRIILRRSGYVDKKIFIKISPVDNVYPFNSLNKK